MEQNLIKKEPLGGGTVVYTSNEYRFGTDAILLADFASPKRRDKICDMGCGGGIIPMLLCRGGAEGEITAIDLQEGAIELTDKAARENGFSNIVPLLADIRDLKNKVTFGSYNVVTCNPPYKKSGAGITNQNAARFIARHEAECDLEDVCKAAERLLISHGKLCICHRPERLCDCFDSMRKHRVEPKLLRCVHQRPGKEPWLVLIEGKRDANPGLRIMPPLYIESTSGELTDEMKEIYGIYKFEGGGEEN